ncbi:MAG: translocation/assembly module TamB domain-containing protein [Chitinophagales bacterium]
MKLSKVFKKLSKWALLLLLLLLFLLFGFYLAIQSPKFQTFIAQKVTKSLSKSIGTEISIDNIEIEFFNNLKLGNLLVRDQQKDTLLFVADVKADLNYFSMFNSTIDLHEINIDGLLVKISRQETDSLFNFSFLNKGTNTTQKKQTNKNEWFLNLDDFIITNSRIQFNDSLTGNIIHTKIPSFVTDLNVFDINENRFSIEQLSLKKPVINFYKTKNNKKEKTPFVLDIASLIYAKNFDITEGQFNFINTLDTNSYPFMAYNNLQFNDLNLSIDEVFVFNDSLDLKISNLSAKEKSGFELKKLSTDLWLNNKGIVLNEFEFKTNLSEVNAKGKLKYRSFEDFANFNNSVRISLDLDKTKINPKDLKYFTDIEKIGISGVFEIDGEIRGRLSSIKAKDIILKAGRNTVFKGDFSLNGLPKIKETFISLRVESLKTNYYDLKYIHNKIPIPINAKRLGQIIFKGKFDGFYSDFVTYGEIITALGYAKTDINFKLAENGTPSYSGSLYGRELDLGKWFDKEELIGKVTLNTSLKGKGVKLNTLDASLKGNIEQITLKGYDYKNIIVDGSVKDNFFEGNVKIDDENLKMDFNGLVDATNQIPVFDFSSTVDKIDLKALNIAKQDYTLSGKIKSNFSANNIDNILGDLEIKDLSILSKGDTFNLNTVVLSSTNFNKEKQLSLKTENVDLNISGKYKVSLLPQTVRQIFLITSKDSLVLEDQIIRVDAEITDQSDLISLFVPQLKIPEVIKLSGNLNTKTRSALGAITIPKIQFGNFTANDFISNLYVKNGEIDIINSLPAIYMKDSVLIKDLSFLVKGTRNDLDFNINTTYKKDFTAISLLGNLSYNNELFQLKLDTNSSILINNSFWNVASGNLLSFNKNSFLAENFKVYTATSEANIKVNQENGTNNLIVNLKNINVEDFNDLLKDKGIDLRGKISGEVKLNNFDKEPAINGDLAFLNIYVNDYNVGDFNINSRLDIPDKKVYLSGGLHSKENFIDIKGAYSFDEISTEKDIDIDVFIKQFTIKSLEDFIPEFIGNSSGTVNGNIKIKGSRTTPNLNGYVDVNDVTTTVAFTQVAYTIAYTRAILNDNVIQLAKRVTVQDDEGNVAYGTGKITHENFRNWAVDLEIASNKIKALNTTINDSPDFYGTAYINGGATFIGSTDKPHVYIYGESVENSFLDVPLVEAVSSKEYSFYNFISAKKVVQEKDNNTDDKDAVKIKGATVKLDLDIDQDLELKIILDQDAGDVLKVKGEGNIKIDVGKKAEFVNFFGTYNVTKGDYLFTLQNVVNKPFRIEPNSKINFNGDIYKDATIDMSATYSRKVALDGFISEYLSSDNEELINLAKNRVPVTLFLDLKNKLSKPSISFDIGIDRVDPKLRNYVDSKLQVIQLNDAELNNQIFGVLVLSRFLPSYSSLENSIGSDPSGDVLNTVTELITAQLSRYLTDWASYLVQDLEFYVNFSSYDPSYFSEETLSKRRELQLALSKRFFNDRLSINIGGNFDFGESFEQGANTSNSTFIGANVSFEYAITKNRRWRIKAFTISDYDSFSAQRNRTTRSGIGLSYKREFDDFYDLLNIKRKIKNAESNKKNK